MSPSSAELPEEGRVGICVYFGWLNRFSFIKLLFIAVFSAGLRLFI